MPDKPTMVKVRALQPHTGFGSNYKVGQVYEVDQAIVDSLVVQGKAELASASAPAKPAKAKAAKKGKGRKR